MQANEANVELGVREDVIQGLFNSWEVQDSVAGAPRWLIALGKPTLEKGKLHVPSYGFTLKPDVLWEAAAVVAELKSSTAEKGEPLALAQVLTYAWQLESRYGRTFLPVIVTRYNGWLRAAITAMVDRGLTTDGVRYFEVTTLKSNGKPLHLFDEPRGRWTLGQPPSAPLDAIDSPSGAHWYQALGTNTWFATAEATADRPSFPQGKYSMLSAIGPGDIGPTSEFIFWKGVGVRHGQTSSTPDDKGTYHHLRPGKAKAKIGLFYQG